MENTKIQWATHTFNPWRICTPVSTGCAKCYAAELAKRFGWGEYKKGVPRQRTSAANWKLPLKWNEAAFKVRGATAEIVVERPRVFCASLADWLDDEVPIEWLADLLALIYRTPNLDWLLLTKRPQRWAERVKAAGGLLYMSCDPQDRAASAFVSCWINHNDPPDNVWLGTSVEDQQRAVERIPQLLKIPAKVRFLSVEPMLGPVVFDYCLDGSYTAEFKSHFGSAGIHWVIFGGESGPGARPCDISWVRSGLSQCQSGEVAPYVKQLGSNPVFPPCPVCGKVGRSVTCEHPNPTMPLAVLKDKKGGDPSEWPEDLRVREFPKVRYAT